MRQQKAANGFKRYALTKQEANDLLQKAEGALQQTFPDKGKGFAVALVTVDGNIYTGASYGSDTATLTMHSEASALAHAANHGETAIAAITGPNCHICKQLIWESSIRSRIDTVVIMRKGDGVEQVPISQLMPYPWPDQDGNKTL